MGTNPTLVTAHGLGGLCIPNLTVSRRIDCIGDRARLTPRRRNISASITRPHFCLTQIEPSSSASACKNELLSRFADRVLRVPFRQRVHLQGVSCGGYHSNGGGGCDSCLTIQLSQPGCPFTTHAMVLGDSVPLITRPITTRPTDFPRWGETLLFR